MTRAEHMEMLRAEAHRLAEAMSEGMTALPPPAQEVARHLNGADVLIHAMAILIYNCLSESARAGACASCARRLLHGAVEGALRDAEAKAPLNDCAGRRVH